MADIKINLGTLENVSDELYWYMRAIEDMKAALNEIHQIIGNQSGEAIETIRARKEVLESNMMNYKEMVNEIYRMIHDYVNEMRGYIKPNAKYADMRVDRDDIWYNLTQLDASRTVKELEQTWGLTQASFSDSEEKKQAIASNWQTVEYMKADIANLQARLDDKLYEMEQLFNQKVVPFDECDHYFKARARELYNKYTDRGEWQADNRNVIPKIWFGFSSGATDMLTGITSSVGGMLNYGSAWLIQGVSNLFGLTPPDWVADAIAGGNEVLYAIWKDPSMILEGMGQGAVDTLQDKNKGIWFAVGAIGAELVADMMIAGAIDDPLRAIKYGSKVDNVFNSFDDIIKDIQKTGKLTDDHIDALMKYATHNDDGLQVVLGKYGDGGAEAYLNIAKNWDPPGTYFDLGDAGWNKVSGAVDGEPLEMWKINEAFLDNQIASGKEIILSHNPLDELALTKWSYYQSELRYLQDNGYKFIEKGGLWYAIQ